jgi:aminoglycoside phosphotransferase (APT) family kinase protein
MSRDIGAHHDTTPVRQGQGFDERALEDWMREHVPQFEGPLRVLQFRGGQSNPTYQLLTPNFRYVLRRKPPGQLLRGAHAVDREARALNALGGAGFPVPRVHGLCTDERVIGTWFYVMDMVEGRIFWDATIPGVDATERRACYDSMNATIARLHAIDPDSVGLSDYGKPGNYFERQVSRWSAQYLADTVAGRDSHMDRLLEWLPRNLPRDPTRPVVVHGDFRIDNMIFHPTEPRVVAVLDWELSTLGHPMADFAFHAMMYHMPPHIVAGLKGADLRALNIPSEDKYVAAYCRRTGRQIIPDYHFYLAFSFFRMAAIFHGIKGRAVRGTAASGEAHERARLFPEVARIAWEQATRLDRLNG